MTMRQHMHQGSSRRPSVLSDFGTVLFTTDHAQAQNSCRDSQRIIVSGSLSGCCDLMASVCCQQCSQPEWLHTSPGPGAVLDSLAATLL